MILIISTMFRARARLNQPSKKFQFLQWAHDTSQFSIGYAVFANQYILHSLNGWLRSN